jgi:hypothetical protein
MLGAAQTILNAAAHAFPSLNLKLPIQAEGIALDQLNCINPNPTGTDVALATQVLSWAYGPTGFPGRFFAQLNFVSATSPPDCISPCPLDMTENPHSPYSVFNLIRQYQQQGVGLQDVAAAVDGAVDSCRQNGGIWPCTPTPCGDLNPVQYATVSQYTWNVAQTFAPTFGEISRGDGTTATGTASPCPITSDEQALMRPVFSAATTQMEQSQFPTSVSSSQVRTTASGLAYSRGIAVPPSHDLAVTVTDWSTLDLQAQAVAFQ